MKIVLPFPPSVLSGHAKFKGGYNYAKARATSEFRDKAKQATIDAGEVALPDQGDISIAIHFYPANNRGDRVNYAGRMKALIDGIADALGVNDKRFLPSYHFYEPEAPGRVEVELFTRGEGAKIAENLRVATDYVLEEGRTGECVNTQAGPVIKAVEKPHE